MQLDHAMPSTPKFPNNPLLVNASPVIINTPSKLERFLQAAENNGILGVFSHHSSLSLKGYGPDIMHHISVSNLADVGMPPGNAICLKEYASKWWTEKCQHGVKCPCNMETECQASTSAPPPIVHTTPLSKHLCFQKCFNDGGEMTMYGPGIATGRREDNADYVWWVYSKDLKMYVPLLPDNVPIIK